MTPKSTRNAPVPNGDASDGQRRQPRTFIFSAPPTVQNTLDRFWQGFFTSLARQGLEPLDNYIVKAQAKTCMWTWVMGQGHGNSLIVSTENPLQASCSAGHTITQGVANEVESG